MKPLGCSGKQRFTCSGDRAFTLIEIMIVLAIFGIVVAIALPHFLRTRQIAQRNVCLENLRTIEHAKQLWGLENGKHDGDEVEEESFLPYLKTPPSCPSGGEYDYGSIGGEVTCTIDGHGFRR